MNAIAERLKEERARLGLTQEQFGEACGVRRRAQAAYEGGERSPDVAYLMAAGRAGVDLKYLLSGVRGSDDERARLAVEQLYRDMCAELGIPVSTVDMSIALAIQRDSEPISPAARTKAAAEIARGALSQSRRLNSIEVAQAVDWNTLAEVISGLESEWAAIGNSPSAIARAHKVSSVYARAIEEGHIDGDVIRGAARATPAARPK